MSNTRPRVYAAHPISSYGTEHATGRVAQLHELLPRAEIVDPEGFGWDEDAWSEQWPDIFEGLAALVVFSASDRTVGYGCVTEICDAIANRLPLAGLDHRGLRQLDGLRFVSERFRTWRQTARLVLGPAIEAAGFPGGWRAC